MNEPQAPAAPEPVPVATPPPLPPIVVRPLFSKPVFALCALLGLGAIAHQGWNYFTRPRLQQLYYPAHTAARVAEAMLTYQAAPGPVPEVERVLANLFGTDPTSTTNEAVRVCQDIFDMQEPGQLTRDDEAGLRVVLGTILGESGRTNALARLLDEPITALPAPHLMLLRRLYLRGEPVEKISKELPHSSVMGDWTRDRLAARNAFLAGKKHDIAPEILERSARAHLQSLALFVFISLGCVAGGAVILYALFTGAGRSLPAGQTAAPWHWRDAFGLVLIVEFLALVFHYQLAGSPFELVRSLAGHLYLLIPLVALLVLSRFILFRRHGLRLRDQFRIARWKPFLAGTLALFACEFVGSGLLMVLLRHMNLDSHWAEGVNEYLIYEPGWACALILLNMSVIGPCYEELQMRRIIHGTLRTRFPILVAAMLSASVFAFLHFYSLPGFISVWWFGFSAALVYERTRSLPACIAGHLLTNFILGGQQILALG